MEIKEIELKLCAASMSQNEKGSDPFFRACQRARFLLWKAQLPQEGAVAGIAAQRLEPRLYT
jgi:hypothetical protein